MEKLLPLILILFAAPCFGDPDRKCIIRAENVDSFMQQHERCKKGELMFVIVPSDARGLSTFDLNNFASVYCNYDFAVVITDNTPALTCVYRGKFRKGA